MFTKDLNSIYTGASDTYAKAFGYDYGEDIIGFDDLKLTKSEKYANILRQSDYQVITTEKPLINYVEEVAVPNFSGTRILSISKYPLYDDNNKLTGIYCIARDITTQTTLKKEVTELRSTLTDALRINEEKTNFLIRMSYDIRTPLTGIMGLASLCETYLDDKTKLSESLKQINDSGKYLVSVVSEILDMTKLEAGDVELNICDFNFNDFLENSKAMLTAAAATKNINFKFNVDQIAHPYVLGDPIRIEQIITNLGTNAINYTPFGGNVDINIFEKDSTVSSVTYKMTFKDSGTGIPPEILEHIFDPLSDEFKENPMHDFSTGLSLALVKSIASLFDGSVKVESSAATGTVFTVEITLSLQDELSEAEAEATINDLLNEDFTGKRALLVEDNELNAEIAKEILSLTNITVDRAEDGQEAVNIIVNSDPGYYNIVFMDVQMPIMNGYEATNAVRTSGRPDLEKLPIVAMTANAFVSDINAAKEAGMNEHLATPIDFDKLLFVLNKWVQ